jgi:hypothetical protein
MSIDADPDLSSSEVLRLPEDVESCVKSEEREVVRGRVITGQSESQVTACAVGVCLTSGVCVRESECGGAERGELHDRVRGGGRRARCAVPL